jgi:hypothetical protein
MVLCSGGIGALLLGSFMAFMASQGMGFLEEPWATTPIQVIASFACGGFLGFVVGACVGMIGALPFALVLYYYDERMSVPSTSPFNGAGSTPSPAAPPPAA